VNKLSNNSDDTVAIIYHNLSKAVAWHAQYNNKDVTISFPHTTNDKNFFSAQCRIVSYHQAK
jgi:threonine dehydratase